MARINCWRVSSKFDFKSNKKFSDISLSLAVLKFSADEELKKICYMWNIIKFQVGFVYFQQKYDSGHCTILLVEKEER